MHNRSSTKLCIELSILFNILEKLVTLLEVTVHALVNVLVLSVAVISVIF